MGGSGSLVAFSSIRRFAKRCQWRFQNRHIRLLPLGSIPPRSGGPAVEAGWYACGEGGAVRVWRPVRA